jgi:hypothetical protein
MTTTAHSFNSIEEMDQHQIDREVQEALRVKAMSPEEYGYWLEHTWGKMQRDAAIFRPVIPVRHAVRHYSSWEEKNAFDDAREIEEALLYKKQREQAMNNERPSASEGDQINDQPSTETQDRQRQGKSPV